MGHLVMRYYDIFEIFLDGSVAWRGAASDREDALHKLEEQAALTKNEVRLMNLRSKEIIASVNTPKREQSPDLRFGRSGGRQLGTFPDPEIQQPPD
jgi:hypothetical protein